jgi:hypothetical protein
MVFAMNHGVEYKNPWFDVGFFPCTNSPVQIPPVNASNAEGARFRMGRAMIRNLPCLLTNTARLSTSSL